MPATTTAPPVLSMRRVALRRRRPPACSEACPPTTDGCACRPCVERANILRLGGQGVCEQRGRAATRRAGAPRRLLCAQSVDTHLMHVACRRWASRATLPGSRAQPPRLMRRRRAGGATRARATGLADACASQRSTRNRTTSAASVCRPPHPRAHGEGRAFRWCCLTSGARWTRALCVAITLRPQRRSGRTPLQQSLLRYSLHLRAHVRPCAPARVESAVKAPGDPHALGAVLGGRPLLTLSFEDMHMEVGQPTVHRA